MRWRQKLTDKLKIEKPLAYLDQNVLDLFVKGQAAELMEEMAARFHVVYSDETLKEISRSGEYDVKFIDVLKRLNAYHIRVKTEEGSFLIRGDATVNDSGPDHIYREYINNKASGKDIISSGNKWLHKFFGGRPDESFSSICTEQRLAFETLLGEMDSHAKDAEKEFPGMRDVIDSQRQEMLGQLESAMREIEERMQHDIGDGLEWSGVNDFRNSIELGPAELNNIEPPNVVKKIWELVQSKEKKLSSVPLEEFLSFGKAAAQPERSLHAYEKVHAIYHMLNMVGYFPDSKQHKERRFIAAQSDAGHAAMASFCDMVFSRDERFVNKLGAALEYLEIETAVCFVRLKSA